MQHCKKCNRPIENNGLCDRCRIDKQIRTEEVIKTIGKGVLQIGPIIIMILTRGKLKPKL
jgi:hypothetical protein